MLLDWRQPVLIQNCQLKLQLQPLLLKLQGLQACRLGLQRAMWGAQPPGEVPVDYRVLTISQCTIVNSLCGLSLFLRICSIAIFRVATSDSERLARRKEPTPLLQKEQRPAQQGVEVCVGPFASLYIHAFCPLRQLAAVTKRVLLLLLYGRSNVYGRPACCFRWLIQGFLGLLRQVFAVHDSFWLKKCTLVTVIQMRLLNQTSNVHSVDPFHVRSRRVVTLISSHFTLFRDLLRS